MKSQTIFLSSTCYDLTDIRQMLSQFITEELRLSVSRSDDAADSVFDIKDGLPAIESCLLNLAQADWVVFILDRRYGPPLKKLGGINYGDKSATHVEMEHALNRKKNTMLFVRSQLLSLYDSYAKEWSGGGMSGDRFESLRPRWLSSHKDLRLFSLIEMYSKTNGWRESFTSFNDIKKLLWNQFRKYRYRADINDRILRNDVPHLVVRLGSSRQLPNGQFRIEAQLANTTGQLAYNVRVELIDDNVQGPRGLASPQLNFVAAGQAVDTIFSLPAHGIRSDSSYSLVVTYDFGVSQEVEDRYGLRMSRAGEFYIENKTKIYYVGSGTEDPGPRIVFRD